MDIDATDMKFIASLMDALDKFATSNGGYHVNQTEVWYEGDFLGRIHYNIANDGRYTFRAAGVDA